MQNLHSVEITHFDSCSLVSCALRLAFQQRTFQLSSFWGELSRQLTHCVNAMKPRKTVSALIVGTLCRL